MTDRSRRFATRGSGGALAIVAATALGLPSHALATSSGWNLPTADDATKTMSVTSVQQSSVVNLDDGDPLPGVRHHWPPSLNGGRPLDLVVRQY